MANTDQNHLAERLDRASKSSAAIVWARLTRMIGIPVAIVVLGWAGVELRQIRTSVDEALRTQAGFHERLGRIEEDMRSIFNTRYTSADAIRDQRTQATIDANQDRRLEDIEDRLPWTARN